MRYLAGLFDAPGPAAAALAALHTAGVELRDIRVVTAEDPGLRGHESTVTALLRDRGVPPDTAGDLGRAVARGAFLLFARAPSARAAAAAAALRGLGALDPSSFPPPTPPQTDEAVANAGDAAAY